MKKGTDHSVPNLKIVAIPHAPAWTGRSVPFFNLLTTALEFHLDRHSVEAPSNLATPSSTWRCAAVLASASVLVFALDALLFRIFYPPLLDPNSSTGLFELILRRELAAQTHSGDNLVVTLGNSRFGYSRKLLDHRPDKSAYTFRDAGIAGSGPRVWYYMLRDLDPSRQRYRAVVFGVDDYDDEDRLENPDDAIRDLHFVIARLRLSDILDFPRSFHTPELQWTVFRECLLKGSVYQADVQAFLSSPRRRLANVELYNRGFAQWDYDYLPPERNLAGLSIDWRTLAVTFPPGADEDQRNTVNSFLAHAPEPQTGRLAAFRRLWLGRIADLYRQSRTKIILIRLPRGPIPRPDHLVRKQSSSIRELASRPNVILADEHAFESLERPEFFRDGMHLNRAGESRFSTMLEDQVVRGLKKGD